MLDDKGSQPIELMGSKSVGFCHNNRIQPKLGNIISLLDMNMRRF
jgi:hypothetical protein